MKIAIIDYGSGNLRSAQKAFERAASEADLTAEVAVSSDPDFISAADRVVLPGVGAYADCRAGLDAVDGLLDALNESVVNKARPFFGICVGMQLMAERGLEKATTNGLGWIGGDVVLMQPDDPSLKIPQIGWNTLEQENPHPLLNGIEIGENGLHAYFVHSYHLDCTNPEEKIASINYGGPVTAIVGRDKPDRHPVSPGKKPASGSCFDLEFLEVEAMSKILFPAIDLKDGECVRLKLGDMDQATVYNSDPGAQAKAFEEQGFSWLHVVDLNGAFEGESVNGKAVETILAHTANPVQLGGGIRTVEHIANWIEKGIKRVILGTVAVRNPALVVEACKEFEGRIAVGIDAKGGKVAVEGWAEASEMGVIELAKRFEGAGVSAIIYTDIDRDGILTGINWDKTIELADAVSIPVIASGGLASIEDVKTLASPECSKLEGAITGRALYDGRLDAAEALEILQC